MFEGLKLVETLDINFNFNGLLEYGIGTILKGASKMPNLKKLIFDAGQSEVNDEDHAQIFVELDNAAKTIPKIKFSFLNTAITSEVSEALAKRYENHPVI